MRDPQEHERIMNVLFHTFQVAEFTFQTEGYRFVRDMLPTVVQRFTMSRNLDALKTVRAWYG